MWALARVDLGVNDSEFWRLSFRRYRALMERALDLRKRADLRAGVVAASLHNLLSRRSVNPEDFFPSLAPEPRKPQTWREQLAIAEVLNRAFGGVDLREGA